MHKGLEITAEFMGNGQVPYQFKSIIKGKKKDPVPMIGLDIPPKEEMKRIQRRRYVRADAVLDVAVKMEAEKNAFQMVSSNMSAGGIAVVLPEHISAEPGEKLYVSFSLSEKENTADITAEAVTQRVFYDEKAAKRKMTLEFTDIDPASHQHILRHCMRAQLQQRRNSLPE